MAQFAGRVEAQIKVPTGGAAVSASLGSMASPVTVTVPAGNYYYTAAGDIASILTTLQNGLNDNVQGYPQTAAAMQAAVGYGTWTAGWLFNIASGNDAGVFGGVTLTATGTPTYGNRGTAGATTATIDKAVGCDSSGDYFNGGNVLDVGANDIAFACVLKVTNPAASTMYLARKTTFGPTHGWFLYTYTDGKVYVNIGDGVTELGNVGATIQADTWSVLMFCLDRSTNKARIAVRSLVDGTTSISAEISAAAVGSIVNADNFIVGSHSLGAGQSWLCAGAYIAVGSGAATGMSANLATAIANFANAVNASWTVSQNQTDTGRITVSNSFWPAYVQFTSTSLRDVLGYAYDFDYPQTAAQMATALGYGTWTNGFGWLCNEGSGSLAAVFGSAALAPVSTPVYSGQGVRGGSDKAVSFDSALDAFSGGASILNPSATDDLIFVWVGYCAAAPGGSRDWMSKGSAPGYYLWRTAGNALTFTVNNIVNATATSVPLNEPHVGICLVDRTLQVSQVALIGIRSGTTSISSTANVAAQGTLAGVVNFVIGSGAGVANADTDLKYSACYAVSGAGIAAGLSANIATALSNFATYMKSQTTTQSARGIWLPNCPISLVGDPTQAPRVTDKRDTMSPTGQMFSVAGNAYRRHQSVMWESVPQAQTWASFAPYVNSSFEEFANDCLYGFGHTWFRPGSPLQIYWDNAGTQRALGYTYNSNAGVPGWCVVNLRSTEPKRSYGAWTGYFRIEFGDVVSTE